MKKRLVQDLCRWIIFSGRFKHLFIMPKKKGNERILEEQCPLEENSTRLHKRTVHFFRFLPVSREKYLFKNRTNEVPPNSYYHSLYPKIIQDIEVSIPLLLLSIWVTSILSVGRFWSCNYTGGVIITVSSSLSSFLLVYRRLRRTGVVADTTCRGSSADQRTAKAFTAYSMTTTRSSAASETTPLRCVRVWRCSCWRILCLFVFCVL